VFNSSRWNTNCNMSIIIVSKHSISNTCQIETFYTKHESKLNKTWIKNWIRTEQTWIKSETKHESKPNQNFRKNTCHPVTFCNNQHDIHNLCIKYFKYPWSLWQFGLIYKVAWLRRDPFFISSITFSVFCRFWIPPVQRAYGDKNWGTSVRNL
jgi:hypothetical protein